MASIAFTDSKINLSLMRVLIYSLLLNLASSKCHYEPQCAKAGLSTCEFEGSEKGSERVGTSFPQQEHEQYCKQQCSNDPECRGIDLNLNSGNIYWCYLLIEDNYELRNIGGSAKYEAFKKVCTKETQYTPNAVEEDIWKMYNVISDQQLDNQDLTKLSTYIHIWDETKPLSQDGILSNQDVQKHTQEYKTLWDGIVDAAKRMRVNDGDAITEQDLKILKAEIAEAKANLQLWQDQMQQMKINLKRTTGNPNAIINFTITDVVDHAKKEVNAFTSRITTAFGRLTDAKNPNKLSLNRVQTTKAYMGIMLGLMKNGTNAITFDEYKKNLKYIDDLAVKKLSEIQNARAKLNAGRMGKEKLATLGHENATYSTRADTDL